MDASLSQLPWQLAVPKGVGGSILAELLHTCCLTNKERSRAASCGDDTRRVMSHHMWNGTGVLMLQKGGLKRLCWTVLVRRKWSGGVVDHSSSFHMLRASLANKPSSGWGDQHSEWPFNFF